LQNFIPLLIVENAQFPPAQKLIRKNVGYELDLPEYFFSGTGADSKSTPCFLSHSPPRTHTRSKPKSMARESSPRSIG